MITVESTEQVAPLAGEWDALAERLQAPPFLGPDWIAAHWDAFGAGRLTIISVRRDGRLGAVLALARHRGTARSITGPQTPQFGMLSEDPELADRAMDAVGRLKVSRLALSYVDREDPLAGAVRKYARGRGERVVERLMLRSPYIELDGTWTEFRAGLSSTFRSNMSRRARRLGERGDAQLDVRDGTEDLAELLAQGWQLESSGWKGQVGTAVAAQIATQRFYGELSRRCAARGRLRLYYLRLDGAPIAFMIGLEQHRVLYLLKGGFDPGYGTFSPGQLLLARLVERCYAQHLRRIELLGGSEPHKLHWTGLAHERISVQSFGSSPLRVAEWGLYAHGRPLALRLGLDRRLVPLRDRARVTRQALRQLKGSARSGKRLD